MTNVQVTLCALRVDNVTILADTVTFLITLLKVVLAINGIDTNQFNAHSSRTAAMSAFARYHQRNMVNVPFQCQDQFCGTVCLMISDCWMI